MLMLSSPDPMLQSEVTSGGDNYRPILDLGRGGMARVYLAERSGRGLRRLVVLKVLEPSLAVDREMRASFRREAELCARLNHPNIVQVFEVIDDGPAPMMIMEYVEGVALSQILSRTDGRLPLRQHIHIIMQVLAGLHYFHELRDADGNSQRAVHRDVSPQNVLVMHEGAVKVLDFGIAKVREPGSADVTQAGIIKGKLSYMPGEQVAGDASIDHRADIFAAGVMLWEAFARHRMWQGWKQADVVKALMANEIPSIKEACPWISAPWEAIINKATAGRREDRFDTALDMQIAMEESISEFGGAVPQRELASFMRSEFGEWRRERQWLVDAELAKPAVALNSVLVATTTQSAQLEKVPVTASSVVFSAVKSPHRLRWVVAGLLLIASAAALVQLGSEPKQSPVAEAPSKQARLSISASPASATISVDGRAAQENPWSQLLPRSTKLVRVEVTADGFVSQSREVQVDGDTSLTVQLSPVVSATNAPSAPTSVSASMPAPSSSGRGARRPPARWAPVTHPAAAAPRTNCSPPYTMDAEGVKTYKPECM